MEGGENPYNKAVRLYNELYSLTLNLAEAADSHDSVPFEFGEILCTRSEEDWKKDLTDSTADDQMRMYSYFLSQTWEEANRYFNGGFSTSLKEKYDEEVNWEAYDKIMQDYKGLSMDIKKLDAAIGAILEKTPSNDPEDFISTELIHKGPGIVK